MAGRVTLLILMTSLFAAAWSTDRPPGQTAEPVVPDQIYPPNSVRETALRRWPISSYQRVVDATQEWAPQTIADLPSETAPILPDQRAAAIFAHVLAGRWIDAGLLLRAEAADVRSPLSTRMSSQPKPGEAHRH